MKPTLKISLDDIKTNWKSLNKASKGKAAAVVKANAYGMGMLRIVEALLEAGCCYFYVANINEALKLREKFNSKQISIAVFEGYFEGNQKIYAENDLIPILNSLEQVKRFKNYATLQQKTKAILNIDTGMNRLGLNQTESEFLIKNKVILDNIELEYIMSHLANAQ